MSRRQKPEVFTGTAAELRALLDERAVYARRIMERMLAGDHDGCAGAQRQMREAFPDEIIRSIPKRKSLPSERLAHAAQHVSQSNREG